AAPSDPAGTLDALLALAAAGAPTDEALAYLEANSAALAEYAAVGGGTAGKTVLGLTAAGRDARAFAGQDFVIMLTGLLSPTGQYGAATAYEQATAISALAAAGEAAAPEAIEWLVEQQEESGDLAGSWDDGFGTEGSTDATAAALKALIDSGLVLSDLGVQSSLNFLEMSQLPSGGWAYAPGLPESPNSTALAIQAIDAAGEDAGAQDARWAATGSPPLQALLSWQVDSGAFQADLGQGRADNFYATVQAAPALAAIAETGAQDPADDAPAAFAGGESKLPFFLLAVMFLLLAGAIFLLYGRKGS
ncbi:MAG: hypothetical protein ACRDHL_01860, partial [Candidatus Promineifilaceae bacterium]